MANRKDMNATLLKPPLAISQGWLLANPEPIGSAPVRNGGWSMASQRRDSPCTTGSMRNRG